MAMTTAASAPNKNNDCYYFYYSSCSKGNWCPFRHEPAALANEKVCTFWKAGACTRPNCMFRHLEVGGSNNKRRERREVTRCYWETQPGGCGKPHCPFLHTGGGRREEVVHQPPVVVSVSPPAAAPNSVVGDGGSIIINRNKLKALQKILPTLGSQQEPEGEKEGPKRVVVPPGTGGLARQTVTGGVKNRLGKTGSVKSRLGTKDDAVVQRERRHRDDSSDAENLESVVIIEEVDDDDENEEEERLRKFAIKSLDLRGRINTNDGKRLKYSDSDSETEVLKKRTKKVKRKKEKVKEGKVKKKAKKKAAKEKKRAKSRSEEKSSPRELPTDNLLDLTRKAVHETNRSYQDLPSASDYSDLDSPRGSPGPQLASVISRTDKAGSLQSDFLEQGGGSSAKRRLGRRMCDREEEALTVRRRRKCDREEEAVRRRRSEEAAAGNNEEVVVVKNEEELRRKRTVSSLPPGQTYFAKILGDLRRQGGGRSSEKQKKSEVVYDNMRIEVVNTPVKDRLGVRRKEKEASEEVKVKKTLERKRRKAVENESSEEEEILKKKKSDRSERTKTTVDTSALRPREVKSQVTKPGDDDAAGSKEDDQMSREDERVAKEEDSRPKEDADYAPFGKRKLRLRSKVATSSLSSLNCTPVKTPRMSDLKSPGSRASESLVLDDSLDLAASGSQTFDNDGEDIMKQLDDFIND